MRHLNPRHLLGWAGLAAIAAFAVKADFVPQSWPTIGAGIWLLYLLQKGLGNLSQFIILQVCMEVDLQHAECRIAVHVLN